MAVVRTSLFSPKTNMFPYNIRKLSAKENIIISKQVLC